MNFQTTKQHEEFRAKVRAFAESEVKPVAFLLDKENRFPDEIVSKMGALGLMGVPYPTEYGGDWTCSAMPLPWRSSRG